MRHHPDAFVRVAALAGALAFDAPAAAAQLPVIFSPDITAQYGSSLPALLLGALAIAALSRRPRARARVASAAWVAALVLWGESIHAAPAAYHSAVQADAPLLWYQFNEAAGNAINHGSYGASYDGLYNGAIGRQVATHAGDTGIAIGGNTQYIDSISASTLTGNPTFSIETVVFLQPGGPANLWGPLLHWGDGGGGDNAPQRTGAEVYFSIQNNNNNRLFTGFYNAGLRTTNLVPTGQWIHVVWTRVGGNDSATGTILYINGVPAALQQDPNLSPGFLPAGSISIGATAFRINRGRDFFIAGRYFTGRMDEIALYDRVLTPSEVQAHAIAAGVAGGAQLPVIFSPDITAQYGTSLSALVEDGDAAHDSGAGSVAIPANLAGIFAALPAGAEVAGFELSTSPAVGSLLAVDTTVELPGLPAGSPAEPQDIVRYDSGSSTYSFFFDGSANSVPAGVAIDAVAADASNALLISFDTTVTLPGVGTVDDEDVVRFASGSYTMVFDGSALGVPAELDVDAAQRVVPGNSLQLSFDGSGGVGGVAFDDEDVVAFDTVALTYSKYFDGSTSDPTDWPAADLVGLPEPGFVPSLFAGALALAGARRARKQIGG